MNVHCLAGDPFGSAESGYIKVNGPLPTVVLGKNEVKINGQEVPLHVWIVASSQMRLECYLMPFFTEQPAEGDYWQTSPARITQGLLLQPTGKVR